MKSILTIGLLLALQGAQATDLKLYGLLDTAVSVKNHQASGGRRTEVGNSLVAASHWGIEGRERLDEGMAAYFRLESNIAPDTGAAGAAVAGQSRFWNRQAFVGLSAGMVQLSVGRQFAAHIDRFVTSLDVWGAAGSAHAVPMGLIGINRFLGDNRVDDAVRVAIVSGPVQGSISASASEGRGAHRSAEIAYVEDGRTLTLFGARYEAPDALVVQGRRASHRTLGLGGQVRWAGVDWIAYGADARFEAVGKPTEQHRIYALNAGYLTLPWLFRAGFTHDRADDLNNVSARDGSKQTLVLSVDHYFSRRTRAVLSLTHNRYADGYKLDALNIAALGRAADAAAVSAIGLGLRHAF